MFKVYKVRLREDEDAEKNDLRNTIGFDNAVRVKSFNVWHGCCSDSVVWKPLQLPPVVTKYEIFPSISGQTSLGETVERNANLDETINIRPLSENSKPGVSQLVKKYLKKQPGNNEKLAFPKIKWQSSHNERNGLRKRKNLREYELHSSMVAKLKERANSAFFSPNCRGKWIILASSLINNRHTLEDLWRKLLDELHQISYQNCNITFQTDPDRILVYTNFLSSTMIPNVITSVREMVANMKYVVHPCGEVLSWNGKEVMIV